MGKLNIAHHKSYHPYRRDNIDRVRRDEAEAAQKEAEQESRMTLADAEARLTLLRERAGLAGGGKGKARAIEDGAGAPLGASETRVGSGKHINLFEELEQQELLVAARASKKTPAITEADKGVPLAPSAKDLNPWYVDKKRHDKLQTENGDAGDEPRREHMHGMSNTPRHSRIRDSSSKTMHDPLTAINRELASRSSSSSNDPRAVPDRRPPRKGGARSADPRAPPPPPPQPKRIDPAAARLRESSERDRALALIRRKKREAAGGETPSTVHGGMDSGYGDVFNRREVEEARRRRYR